MTLSASDKLGPYEILALIGKGGMGEVYRACDPRLNRDVAIKVSAAQFSERFEREAKAIAALNHPNICQIYDVGPNYLVMEFIEGESPTGPMPLDEALRIARQIADALGGRNAVGVFFTKPAFQPPARSAQGHRAGGHGRGLRAFFLNRRAVGGVFRRRETEEDFGGRRLSDRLV